MASFVKLQKDIDGQRFHLIIQEAEGGFRFEVESDDNDLIIEGLSKTLSTKAAVEALHVLTDTQPCLSDKRIEVQVNKSTELSIKAAWISVFEVSQKYIEAYRKEIIDYLDGRGIHDLEDVIRYAFSSDANVRDKALNKLKSFKFENAEQKAKVYDLCVDLQIEPFFNNAPLESEKLTETERFWTRYCIQAIKRIPTIVYSRPPLPTSGIEKIVARVGGITNVALFELYENLNANEVMNGLVCQQKGAESWYEKIRIMRVWSQDVDQVILGLTETFQKALTEKVNLPDYILRKGLFAEIRERWEEWRDEVLHHYIPLDVTSSPNSPVRNELNGVIDSFLADEKKRTFLLQGDSGSGKTSFARYLEWRLIEEDSGYLPIYIALNPDNCRKLEKLIKNIVKEHDEDHLKRHKKEQKFLFILDGYDETQQFYNLFSENDFQDWKQVKVLFTCRSQYLTRLETYRDQFVACNLSGPLSPSTFEEWYLASFDLMQREKCIDSRLLVLNTGWGKEEYLKAFESAPRLNEIVANPFVLTIAIEVLPEFVQANSIDRIDRATLFRSFVKRRFRTNIQKRKKSSQITEKQMFKYSTGLASYLFNSSKLPFGAEDIRSFEKERVKNQILPEELFQHLPPEKLLRIGCPLRKLGDNQFSFLHRSLYEYFIAAEMFESIKTNISQPFSTHFLSAEMDIIDFISELFWQIEDENMQDTIKENLFRFITASKKGVSGKDDNEDDVEIGDIKTSSNAGTILARAGIAFSGKDLSGVNMINADLTGGIFHNTNLYKSILRNAKLQFAQMINTNILDADFSGVDFGEEKTLLIGSAITCISHHPELPQIAIGICDHSERTRGVKGLYQSAIMIWDYVKHENLCTFASSLWQFTGTGKGVKSVKYHPNGKVVLAVCFEEYVRQWDIQTQKNTYLHESDGSPAIDACYKPDGSQIFVAKSSDDFVRGEEGGMVYAWNSNGRGKTNFLKKHGEDILCVCSNHSGTGIATGSMDHTVIHWDVETRQKKWIYQGHQNEVLSVCYSPNEKEIVSGSADCNLIQWCVLDGSLIRKLLGHKDSVNSVCYNFDGQLIASCSDDRSVRLWRSTNGLPIRVFGGHIQRVNGVCFGVGMNSDLLLSVSDDGTVRKWHCSTNQSLQNTGHRGRVCCVTYDKITKSILSGSEDKSIRRWQASNGKFVEVYDTPHVALSIASSPIQELFLSGLTMKKMLLWKKSEDTTPKKLNGHKSFVTCVKFSPDGVHFLSGSLDGTIRLWDVSSGNSIFTFEKKVKYEYHGSPVWDISYSSDGSNFLSAHDDGFTHLWSLSKQCHEKEFNVDSSKVCSVQFSPDGSQFLAGSIDLHKWNVSKGNEIHTFEGHKFWILSVCYSPSGKKCVSGSLDRSCRIWDTQTAQCLTILKGQSQAIFSVDWFQFNNKDRVVSGSGDSTIAVWEKIEENNNDNDEKWGMVWLSQRTPLKTFGCQWNDATVLSIANRRLIEQRSKEVVANPIQHYRDDFFDMLIRRGKYCHDIIENDSD